MVKNSPKRPIVVQDEKDIYFRQDFVTKTIKGAAKFFADGFKKQYLEHNIDEPSARGEDVDVRLEKSICELNCKNIKHVCDYLAKYFDECVERK